MILWDLQPREQADVRGVHSPVDQALATRLKDLGFAPGQRVECVRRLPFSGPKIFQIQNCLFALEKELAQVIDVQKVTRS